MGLLIEFPQTVAQLLSVAMVIYAFNSARHPSASAILLQPWFIVLAIAGALERIAGRALGVTMERDWVVLVSLMLSPFLRPLIL